MPEWAIIMIALGLLGIAAAIVGINNQLEASKAGKEPPTVYHIGGTWGNAIQWHDTVNRKVVGWKPRRPEIGDLLISEKMSGRIGVFRFIDVELLSDPHDMFWATVADIGYADEPKIAALLETTQTDMAENLVLDLKKCGAGATITTRS